MTAQRLATITTSVGGVERRAYELSYAPDDAFPVARLSGVSSTGVGHELSWPALSFAYASPAPAAIEPIAGIGVWRLNNNGTDAGRPRRRRRGGPAATRRWWPQLPLNQSGTFGVARLARRQRAEHLRGCSSRTSTATRGAELVRDTGAAGACALVHAARWVKRTDAWPGTAASGSSSRRRRGSPTSTATGSSTPSSGTTTASSIHTRRATGFSAVAQVGRIGGTVLPAIAAGSRTSTATASTTTSWSRSIARRVPRPRRRDVRARRAGSCIRSWVT